LGGIGPVVMTDRLGYSLRVVNTVESASPTMRLESPRWLGMPKRRCRVGLMRSASSAMTFLPVWEMVCARYCTTVLLPSLGEGLVTRMTFISLSTAANCRLVRRTRNASATGLREPL